jgi:hypothetical protein
MIRQVHGSVGTAIVVTAHKHNTPNQHAHALVCVLGNWYKISSVFFVVVAVVNAIIIIIVVIIITIIIIII